METKKTFSTKYVDVLDGIRALSVIIVLIFHFWQQTWIFPTIQTPFLSFIGITSIDFTPFARCGYLFVDMMVLISGFLLFLPVARNIFFGEPLSSWKTYYKKRAVRILPSYFFCVIALFIYELAAGSYGNPVNLGIAFQDLLSHLTFTHMWRIKTYLGTKLNVVLWTLAVEVWFYILFPLFALIIKRHKKESGFVRPLIRVGILAVLMVGISLAFIYGYALNSGSQFSNGIDSLFASLGSDIRSTYPAMFINQLPAFFGTYAVGMVGSCIYVFAASRVKQDKLTGSIFTIISAVLIYIIVQLLKQCSSLEPAKAQIWQVSNRLMLSCVFMGFILSTSFALGFYRFLFSNRLMRFLSAISYNLYIWHQWLCVKLKSDWHIPAWPQFGTTDDAPNTWVNNNIYSAAQQQAGLQWRTEYAIIITLFAFGFATLVTYLIERPATKWLNGRDLKSKAVKPAKRGK
ncbi:MAG: acyltransferase [Clostridia bacterium]|nr:acyltransferase [Clostridia bacterium]